MKRLIADHLAPIVFVLALLPGLAVTTNTHFAVERRLVEDFDRAADLAVDRVLSRVRQHVVALRATRGLWVASDGGVTRNEFARFLASVDLVRDLAGIRGIGFAPMIPADGAAAIELEIRQAYGIAPAPPAPTDQPWRTPVLMIEPTNEVTLPALGFDMYADPTRRAAMNSAIALNATQMSAPVDLVGGAEDGNSTGFLIYLPVMVQDGPHPETKAPASALSTRPFAVRT
jgi:CHASE1-domain containing sensor protein